MAGLEDAAPSEQPQENCYGEEPEQEHGTTENPKFYPEAGNQESKYVDEKRIVGRKRDGVDAVPLGDGMPDARCRTVIGGIEHADFVIPAWSMLVCENNGKEDNSDGNKHCQMEKGQKRTGEIIGKRPEMAERLPCTGVEEDSETTLGRR